VKLGEETAECHLDAGHKADGATFDRFGIMPVLKSPDDGGEVWLEGATADPDDQAARDKAYRIACSEQNRGACA